jgi:hypothetical protein
VKPPTGPIEADEDGNALPVPTPDSDLAQLIALLEYGRKRGFRIGPTVQVGKIATQIADLRQDEGGGGTENDPGPWRAAGYEGDE